MAPKIPEGEMKLAELKRLIKKYDELMGIDPKGKSRVQLIAEIEKLGYSIDHKNKVLKATFKQKTKKLPKKVEAPAPAPKKAKKTKAQKDKDMRDKVIQYIIDNRDVLDDERLK
tara:strand:- start:4196 stop:4537 length:342 start_codon:yes stop_codon:yes gene_type:complete